MLWTPSSASGTSSLKTLTSAPRCVLGVATPQNVGHRHLAPASPQFAEGILKVVQPALSRTVAPGDEGAAAAVPEQHAALLALGNLVIKGTAACAAVHEEAFTMFMRSLREVSAWPADSLHSALDQARLLSATLRGLVPLITAKPLQASLFGGELLRLLTTAMMFGRSGVLAGVVTPSLGRGAAGDGGSSDGGLLSSGSAPRRARRARRSKPTGAAASKPPSHFTMSDSEGTGLGGATTGGSGSEFSSANTGGAGGGRTRHLPIRVRISALQCLEALARGQRRLVASHWHVCLPQDDALHPRPAAPTLASALLFDPSPKAREAAAAAMTATLAALPISKWVAVTPGTTRDAAASEAAAAPAPDLSAGGVASGQAAVDAFLAAASAAGIGQGASMSQRVQAMVVQVHLALRQALRPETQAPAALTTATLHTLAELVSATPYLRFPPGMLTLCLPQVVALLHCGDVAVQVPALQCLGVLVSTSGTLPEVTQAMLPPRQGSGASLLTVLFDMCGDATPLPVRTEVLGVLAKSARHYSGVISRAWPQVQDTLVASLTHAQHTVRSNGLRVLEELLRARAGTTPIRLARAAAVLSDAASREAASAQDHFALAMAGQPPAGAGFSLQLLVEDLLPRACTDTTAAVRASAITALSYLLPVDWARLLGGGQAEVAGDCRLPVSPAGCALRDRTLSLVVTASRDAVPAVRMAAARAWGALACFREWKTHAFAGLAGAHLLGLVTDPALNVRVRAVWALGNLCATPRRSEAASLHSASTAGLVAPSAAALGGGGGPTPPRRRPAAGRMVGPHTAGSGDVEGDETPLLLSQFVPLPFLRRVALALLAAGSDHDKVSSAAVRTLGLVVKGLVEHLYPRDALEAESAVEEGGAARPPPAPSTAAKDLITPPSSADGRAVVGSVGGRGFTGHSTTLHLSSAASPFETPAPRASPASTSAWAAGLVPSTAHGCSLMVGSALGGAGGAAASKAPVALPAAGQLAADHELICSALVALSRTLVSTAVPPKTLWNACYAARCVLPLCQILINAQRAWRRQGQGLGVADLTASPRVAMTASTPDRKAAKPWARGGGSIPREVAPSTGGAGASPGSRAAPGTPEPDPAATLADLRAPRTVMGPDMGKPVPDATWCLDALLRAVADLLCSSGNYKVRIAAAHAVSDVPGREVLGVTYGPVLEALITACDAAEGPSTDFTEFRYSAALRNALRSALMAVVCYSLRSDYADHQTLLSARAPWLYEWLQREELAAAAAEAEVAAAEGEPASPRTGVPADPADAGLCAAAAAVGAFVSPSGAVAFPPRVVSRAFQVLAAMFESRLKGIELPLLRKFQERAFGKEAVR